MKAFFRFTPFMSVLVLLSACTSIQVKELNTSTHPIKMLCITNNPKVIISDFTMVMEHEFKSRDIKTKTYKDAASTPKSCQYTLTYTARQSWDVSTFMSYAEIRIFKDGLEIASAMYKNSNGFNFNKWASTKTKLKPVFQELFGET